jgi:hypothetical protein
MKIGDTVYYYKGFNKGILVRKKHDEVGVLWDYEDSTVTYYDPSEITDKMSIVVEIKINSVTKRKLFFYNEDEKNEFLNYVDRTWRDHR